MNNHMKKHLYTLVAAACIANLAAAQSLPPPPVSPTPVTTYEYDAQGNRTKVTQGAGALNLQTTTTFDKLGRLKDATDPKNGKTQFQYDGGDRTTQVTDPRNLVTQYPRNGLGDTTQLISPDTGQSTYTYDEAGNVLTRTDSRGVTETYTYDAVGRLTQVVYSQAGQTPQTVSWSYSLTGADYANSIGRLSRTDHPGGSSRFKYDAQGRVTQAVQTVNAAAGANSAPIVTTVKYGYTLGKLTSITYPSGRKLTLVYTNGQVTGLSLAPDEAGTAAPLLSQIQWEPFGGVSSWNWNMAGGGQVPHQRFFDQSGRIVRYRLGDVFRDVTYDAANRIISYTHLSANDGIAQPSLDQNFGYDENGRLTQVTTVASSWAITYDPSGNRTGVSLNGSPSVYTTGATSNRLASITNPARSFQYDNAGNTTSDSPNYTATYGLSESLASITKAGVTGTYTYDADKRRIRKVTSAGASSTIIFVYGLNGELLGEYDQAGQALREYVWLDNIHVAMFMPDPVNPSGAPLVFYIHADHLNAPRLVVDMNNTTRWRWFAEPFGTTAPEVNPSGLGVFAQNLRFPGQYADAETGLSYNYRRLYDSSTGRYTQSDPIGLAGGVGTFTYVAGNPLDKVDPEGLQSTDNPFGPLIPADPFSPEYAQKECKPSCLSPITVVVHGGEVCPMGNEACARAYTSLGYVPGLHKTKYSKVCLASVAAIGKPVVVKGLNWFTGWIGGKAAAAAETRAGIAAMALTGVVEIAKLYRSPYTTLVMLPKIVEEVLEVCKCEDGD